MIKAILLILSLSRFLVSYVAQPALWHLPTTQINQPLRIKGIINNIPTQNSLATSFSLQTSEIAQLPVITQLQLSDYHAKHYLAGSILACTVKLKLIHSLCNPGKKCGPSRFPTYTASGYIDSHFPCKVSGQVNGIDYKLLRLRQSLAEVILANTQDKTLANIMIALTLGIKNNLSADTWQVFQNTGTSHLIAISGLHLGLIAAIFFQVTSFLLRFFPRLLLHYPIKLGASLAAAMGSCIYMSLAGFSVPTLRAFVMILLLLLLVIFKKVDSVGQRLFLAFLIVLFIMPTKLISASLILSFMAVVIIVLITSGRLGTKSKWLALFELQLAITLGLMPITIYFFQQYSLISIAANAFAIPWIGGVIVPLGLLTVILLIFNKVLGLGCLKLTVWLLKPAWLLLNYCSALPWATLYLTPISLLTLATLSLFAYWLILPKLPWSRYWAVLFLLVPLLPSKNIVPKKAVQLLVFDVGQGLGSIIQTAHHVLIYDAGPHYATGFDSGQAIIVPYLKRYIHQPVDVLMISHGDNDHIGGAQAILQHYQVNHIVTSVPEKFPDKAAINCFQGQHWQWDGVDFRVLWPKKESVYSKNDSCCVLQISTGQQQILLTGDIEKPVEAALVREYHTDLHSSVLVAPHHGSKTSSTLAFIQAVNPQWVIFATGFYNRFHFPASEVVARYRANHTLVLDTAQLGFIQLLINEKLHIYSKFITQT